LNKKLMWALVLMLAVVLLLLFNRDRVSVNLIFAELRMMGSLVYLGFAGAGVAIGLLLK